MNIAGGDTVEKGKGLHSLENGMSASSKSKSYAKNKYCLLTMPCRQMEEISTCAVKFFDSSDPVVFLIRAACRILLDSVDNRTKNCHFNKKVVALST